MLKLNSHVTSELTPPRYELVLYNQGVEFEKVARNRVNLILRTRYLQIRVYQNRPPRTRLNTQRTRISGCRIQPDRNVNRFHGPNHT